MMIFIIPFLIAAYSFSESSVCSYISALNTKIEPHEMRFPTIWYLTSVDSDETVQPPIKLRSSK